MEWGNGTDIIWWKIEPDKGNPNSASLYVANYQADKDFKNLNFIDINGNEKSHFIHQFIMAHLTATISYAQ